jgi:DNA-binding IclR family transcriptional regulator
MTLMAFLEQKEVKRILKKNPLEAHTPFSITDENAFRLRLEKVRKQGFIVETGEAVEGVIGIAAPIRDYSRQVVAALGIAVPGGENRKKGTLERLVTLVRNACDDISSDLGYMRI